MHSLRMTKKVIVLLITMAFVGVSHCQTYTCYESYTTNGLPPTGAPYPKSSCTLTSAGYGSYICSGVCKHYRTPAGTLCYRCVGCFFEDSGCYCYTVAGLVVATYEEAECSGAAFGGFRRLCTCGTWSAVFPGLPPQNVSCPTYEDGSTSCTYN
jgi:hypothetical protein